VVYDQIRTVDVAATFGRLALRDGWRRLPQIWALIVRLPALWLAGRRLVYEVKRVFVGQFGTC
jgi:hypothetical protein